MKQLLKKGAYIYTYTHIYIYTPVYVCLYICMYTQTHTNTRTYTHSLVLRQFEKKKYLKIYEISQISKYIYAHILMFVSRIL
jgi:hypothetical protein